MLTTQWYIYKYIYIYIIIPNLGEGIASNVSKGKPLITSRCEFTS